MDSRALAAPLASLALAFSLPATPAALQGGAATPRVAIEAPSLQSIAAWLKASGREGYLAADVADVAGIARGQAEDVVEVSQRGFRSGDVLRVAQVPQDGRRDFVLFMVQRPGGEVVFYFATLRDGLRKAFVSLPASGSVVPLGAEEARSGFRAEISYWEARIAGL